MRERRPPNQETLLTTGVSSVVRLVWNSKGKEHFITAVGGRLTRGLIIFQVQILWQKTDLLYSACIYRLLTWVTF